MRVLLNGTVVGFMRTEFEEMLEVSEGRIQSLKTSANLFNIHHLPFFIVVDYCLQACMAFEKY